jgi:lipoprotein-releasing system permease protein
LIIRLLKFDSNLIQKKLSMSFPFFISKKFTLSRKDSRFITLISSISIIGISLGVATLIIALSILEGFEDTIQKKIIDFDAHIQITSYQTILPAYKRTLRNIREMLNPYLEEVNPYASNLVIISSKFVQEGVSLKGILPENQSLKIDEHIISGEYKLTSTDNPAIIIGKKLAEKIFVNAGDDVTIFALNRNEIPSPENPPKIQEFVVKGIFESEMAEYDDLNAYTDIKSAQELFNLGDNVTGYDIKLRDISKIDSLTIVLSKKLRYPHSVRSIYQKHRNIFTWIELQKKPIPIVLGLIILVAVFNIIGSLLMIVLEKTKAIGILKSLGALNSHILKIFVYQGFFLAVIGILFGNLLAYAIMSLQLNYNIISLPSSVYFTSKVPIILTAKIFIAVSVLTLFLCLTASLIPSSIAARIKPISSLRFS